MGSNVSRHAETRAVMDAVRHIVQSLRESGRAAEQHAGVSGAQLFVLHALADAPAMTMSQLARRTHTHQTSVSTVVARLVERGLVRRVTPTHDARQRLLSLSARGRRLAGRAPDAAQARLILAIDRLSPRRRGLLASTLTELAHAVDAVDRVPSMFFEDRSRRRMRAAERTPRG